MSSRLYQKIITAITNKPLPTILLFGLVVRIAAAIFSKGFLTLDDHHNYVIDADMIASGVPLGSDYKDSALYPIIGAFIMSVGRFFGNTSPNIEMLSIRIFQGLFSLFAVYFIYRILEKTVGKSAAKIGGTLTAISFVIPITAVHQFEEAFCQVPLLASIWLITESSSVEGYSRQRYFIAGLLMAIALIIRLPLISFVGPFTLGMIIQQSTRKQSLYFLIGIILIIVVQSTWNVFINGQFGYTFLTRYGQILEKPTGLMHTEGYPAGPVWRYLLTLLGIFLPPFSLLFLYSAIRGSKIFPIIGISTLSFLIAHSLIANKQERFLLPIIPLIILLAVAGLPIIKSWFEKKSLLKLYSGSWIYFWVLNSILLIVLIFHYGKKDRVEPLVYINDKHNATGIIIMQYNYSFLVPDYYLGKPTPIYYVFEDRKNFNDDFSKVTDSKNPVNYYIVYSDSVDVDKERLENAFHKSLTLETVITPSLGDWVAHLMNPRYNKSNSASIYSSK